MSEKGSLIEWLEGLGLARHLNNSDIMSGITVNAVLAKTVEGYHLRVGEANTAATRMQNWNNLVKQLEKVGLAVGQQQRSKILNGDDKIVYNILYELKAVYSRHKKEVGVDLQQIDIRTDPRNASSMLQLLILLLVKYFGLSVKESVALLSNDSKYLAHILAKGFKESAVQVEGLLSELIRLLPQVSVFCKNKENLTFFVKSFKPGLISKYLSISEISIQLLTEFLKTVEPKYQLIKQELISTYLLCVRRHSCQTSVVVKSISTILGFNKNILDLIQVNGTLKQTCELIMEFISFAEDLRQEKDVMGMFNFDEFVKKVVQSIKSSELFISCCHLLLKLLEINYLQLLENREMMTKVLQNLSLLNLSKKSDIIIQANIFFAMLTVLGKRKNALAPQYFKLAVQKYRNSLNPDQSQNYLQNFLNTIEVFPSIPKNSIVQAILFRYQTGSCNLAELQLQIIENSIKQIDQQTVLRVYNTVTKVFMEEVGKESYLSNIIEAIIRTFDTKIITDLSIKFSKVCLAVFYANLRKLNYSKSLIEGTIKLNSSNAFYKVKNSEIVSLMGHIVEIGDERLNKAIQPLVCYSFFQSEIKNKEEAQQLKKIMLAFGTEQQLRSLYEQDARQLLQQVRKEENKGSERYNQQNKRLQPKTRVNSDVLLLSKKKDYALYNLQPISNDAKQGLQRYSKAFKSRIAKLQLQEEQRRLEEHKMQQLRKKATLKILEKGLKITKEIEVNNLYDFDSKQRELQKEEFNHLQYLPFYDPNKEQDRDVKGMQIVLKKYAPIFKVYYNHYGGKLRPNNIQLFQDISQTAHLMQSANVWKLLRDHNLDYFITIKEVHHTIQKINANLKKEYKDSSLLDYQVFENFLVQVALIMFSRPPKDMRSHPLPEMLIEIVKTLKQNASENKIDQKIFEDEKEDFKVSSQQISSEIKEMNQKLAENSEYILPEGYKKFIKKNIVYEHLIKVEEIQPRFQEVIEVIDQILFAGLGFHIIEPYSTMLVQATARPLLYPQSYEKTNKERSLSSILPKATKNNIQKSQIEDDNLSQSKEEKEEDQDEQRVKLQNRIIKERKQKQLEAKRRKEEQDKKRQLRDKELKQLMEKHKEKQTEVQKEKQRQEEEKRKQQEQQRNSKKKYEQHLKKKVQEYSKIKQAEKLKEELSIREKREQEIRKMVKMKQDIERKKKMVEESKQKKREEQRQKELQEKEAKTLRQQDQKKKAQAEKELKKRLIMQFKERKKKQDQQRSKEKVKESSLEPKSNSEKPVYKKEARPTQEKQAVQDKQPAQEKKKSSAKKQITIQTYQQP